MATTVLITKINKELSKVIVGQEEIIRDIIICLFSEGHLLLRGLPGMAKTTMLQALSNVFGAKFKRVQFTPDLMPSDLIGYEMLDEKKGKRLMEFVPGPIFTQFLLADEINRTPPKTQSALLQAMSERKVAVMGNSRPLERPFIVMATQNPIEQEGTYPLPEAQLDRFMFLVNVDYPSYEEEVLIALSNSEKNLSLLNTVMSSKELLKHIQAATKVKIASTVVKWIVKLVQASRPENEFATKEIKHYVEYGASPRASQNIIGAAKSFAYLEGKKVVEKHHITEVLGPILRHRIQLHFNADVDNITTDSLIAELKKIKL